MTPLTFDPDRVSRDDTTGIMVRGQLSGRWVSMDIACMTRASLLQWLSGERPVEDEDGLRYPNFAAKVLVIVLGYES